MDKIYLHILCYNKNTKEIECYVIAPYEITTINNGIIDAYGKVWQKPDIKAKINKDNIHKPFIEENTDKVFTVNMWSKERALWDNGLKDYFSNELTKLNFPLPESLEHILKP